MRGEGWAVVCVCARVCARVCAVRVRVRVCVRVFVRVQTTRQMSWAVRGGEGAGA